MYMHRKPDLEATGSDMVALGDLLNDINEHKASNRMYQMQCERVDLILLLDLAIRVTRQRSR